MHRTLAVLGALAAMAIAPATAAARWAPADTATIHPGVQTFTEGAQCTANFVFTGGTDVFGCTAGSHQIGTPVEIDGASRPGTLVYNSWLAMQAAGETGDETCRFNDFALVRVDPADHGKVNPSVPFWGGPEGIGDSGTGQTVYSYGNSSLRLGLSPLSPKVGTLEGLPRPVSNNVTDVGNALASARAHGFSGVSLVDGTEPFSGIL